MSQRRNREAARDARSCRRVFWLFLASAGCGTPPAPTHAGPAAPPAAAPLAKAVPAACDRTQRCGSDQPLCLTSPTGSRCGTLAEADALPHDGAHAVLACVARADCAAGEHCCTNPLWDRTRCSASCDPANEAELCEAEADCTGRARCQSSEGGLVAGALPGWVKTCSAE